jgi:hypothetical protein
MNMPMMLPYDKRLDYPDAPVSVPFSLLDAEMATTVHNQSLAKLASRGGLAPNEMLALMEGKNIFIDAVDGFRLMGMTTQVGIKLIKERL